jgi:hypothetical protein
LFVWLACGYLVDGKQFDLMKPLYFTVLFILFSFGAIAQPDTVRVGAYVISMHDINFHDKEYTARFWIWFVYSNPKLDFTQQLDIPNSKSVEQTFPIKDSLEGKAWVMMKMKAVMKEKWNVADFPFDEQHLNVHIENSQYDTSSLIFKPDVKSSKFDPEEALDGWEIKNFEVSTNLKKYETGFGDSRPGKDSQVFSTFQIDMDIQRDALGLFMKIFIGMYISFLIAFLSFAPKPWELDPRFGLPVGGLFAAVGNKYIIDSILPESSTFTLVDTLHTLTFLSIFAMLVVSAYCIRLHDKGKMEACLNLNKKGFTIILIGYVTANILFVCLAIFN